MIKNKNKWIYRSVFSKFDRIYCVSNAIVDQFTNDFPSLHNKTQVFFNFVNQEDIIVRSTNAVESLSDFSIITVGRLAQIKGQTLIPETMRLLLDAGYDYKWYLVGDGQTRQEIEDLIRENHVEDYVILLGTKDNPYPYIKNCTIYVQTSFSEGWGLTVQEAKILQKPIVTTDIPVMHEQITDGENGLLAEPTAEGLFRAIKKLIDHPELQQKFVENLSHETHDNSSELQKLYDFIES